MIVFRNVALCFFSVNIILASASVPDKEGVGAVSEDIFTKLYKCIEVEKQAYRRLNPHAELREAGYFVELCE